MVFMNLSENVFFGSQNDPMFLGNDDKPLENLESFRIFEIEISMNFRDGPTVLRSYLHDLKVLVDGRLCDIHSFPSALAPLDDPWWSQRFKMCHCWLEYRYGSKAKKKKRWKCGLTMVYGRYNYGLWL